MSATRASLFAVLMAAAKGESMYSMSTFFNDTTCTVQARTPFVIPFDLIPASPGSMPIKEAMHGCVNLNDMYISIEGCAIKYYAAAGCEGDPVVEVPVDGPDGPRCSERPGGTSVLMQCVTSVPPGVVDASECLTHLPSTENVSDACEDCMPDEPAYTCGGALGELQACSSQCTPDELEAYAGSVTMIFGCSCGAGDGGHTCGDIKALYKENHCCGGNPGKPFDMAAHRRLAGGPAPRAPAQKAKLSRKARLSRRSPLTSPRRLSSAVAARMAAGARKARSVDTTEHALRALRGIIDGVKLRHGAAAARSLAVKAKALMEV